MNALGVQTLEAYHLQKVHGWHLPILVLLFTLKTATQLTLLLSPELLFLFIEVSVGETSAKYLYSGWFPSDSRKFQWDNNRTETSKYKETSFYSEFGKDIL